MESQRDRLVRVEARKLLQAVGRSIFFQVEEQQKRDEADRIIKEAGRDASAVVQSARSSIDRTLRSALITALALTGSWIGAILAGIVGITGGWNAFWYFTCGGLPVWLLILFAYVSARTQSQNLLRLENDIGYGIMTGGLVERAQLRERIDLLSPRELEEEVARLYDRLGYKVERGRFVGDIGADVIAERNGEKLAIQVKKWTRPVGRPTLQNLQGASAYYRGKPVVVTTSAFTWPAIEYARIQGIELVTGEALIDKLMEAYYSRRSRP